MSIAILFITAATVSEDFVMWKAFTHWLSVQGLRKGLGQSIGGESEDEDGHVKGEP